MDVARFLLFFIGISVGVVLTQLINTRCGDGNVCFCSEQTEIISCVDSNLYRVPSFSGYVKKWVKRLNLRFNHIMDLSRLLQSDFPKLQYVDIRDNPPYLCNEIHHLLVASGLIIESHCVDETTMIIRRTTKKLTSPSNPSTSTTMKQRTKSTTNFPVTVGEEAITTEETTNIDIDISGKVQCDMTVTVSVTAICSTIITSICGLLVTLLCRKLRKGENICLPNNKFDQPRPKNSKPRITLFHDLSDRPSTSKGPIYTGPKKNVVMNSINNESYTIESATDSEEENGYEAPIPPRQASKASVRPAESTYETVKSTSVSIPMKTLPIKSTKKSPTASTLPPPPPPRRPSNPSPSAEVRPATNRGKGRGKGRGVTSISGKVNLTGPPSSNTRSKQLSKNTHYSTHM